ncbi:MAG: cobalamin-binding protein [Spirochaetaceae bacterium]|jgi:iron complex transport system substrate-binding protein|nr:cobalamin-binding protein [Spirochaetaceae bacterium]
MRIKAGFLGAALVLVLGAGLAAQDNRSFPLTMRDAAGRTVTISALPRRIVSLSPAVTEILFAIGAGDRVVGVTEYCNYPPETAKIPKVGGFSGITVNLEQIAVLRPDLVILSAFMHDRLFPLLERLSILNFAVEPRSFEEVYRTIETLGALTGREEAARAVVAQMRATIARAGERRGSRERPGVFWELSDEPLMTAGGGTFISEAIYLGGGRNIFEDLAIEWPTVSVEQVLLRRPAWIIAGDDHGKSIEPAQLARRPGWQGIPAVRNGRVATVSADSLYRYGPRLADAVLAISTILYGE